MADNIHDMADDFGKAIVMASVTVLCMVFCLGIMIGAFLHWGLT